MFCFLCYVRVSRGSTLLILNKVYSLIFITKDILAFLPFITSYASVNAAGVTINCNKAPDGGC